MDTSVLNSREDDRGRMTETNEKRDFVPPGTLVRIVSDLFPGGRQKSN